MSKLSGMSYVRVTLALDIAGVLTNGEYAGKHRLGIVKHLVDFGDEVWVKPSEVLTLTCNDVHVPTDETNTCMKAVRVLQEVYGIAQNVHIHIEKNAPLEGGLAAGSSNAATVMRLLVDHWGLTVTQGDLVALSRRVGMDVGYFFYGGTAYDQEVVGLPQPIDTGLSLHFLIVLPDFGVSTTEAFRGLDYTTLARYVEQTDAMRRAFAAGDVAKIAQNMHNDFETSVFAHYPDLQEIKKQLLDSGALGACMTGSGSTMVGLFSDRAQAEASQHLLSYRSHVCSSVSV